MALNNAPLAFILVLAAGLSTCIGSAVVYNTWAIKFTSKRILASSLGLSAGVMLYVSFIEIFFKAVAAFEDSGEDANDAYLFATLCFFGGIISMKGIDFLVHLFDPADMNHEEIDFDMLEDILKQEEQANDHCHTENQSTKDEHAILSQTDDYPIREIGDIEMKNVTRGDSDNSIQENDNSCGHNHTLTGDQQTLSAKKKVIDKKLKRMGLLTALAIGIHNFPEGLATFVATLDDPAVGAALAVAIAIHNIPEGLCVSMPIFFATGERNRAFAWGVVSGLSEVVAGGLGWLVLAHVVSDAVYGLLFGFVSGMMVSICIYQLLPTAKKYDPVDECVSNSVVVGMMVMAISLVAFQY